MTDSRNGRRRQDSGEQGSRKAERLSPGCRLRWVKVTGKQEEGAGSD